jgi:hypothetical protein
VIIIVQEARVVGRLVYTKILNIIQVIGLKPVIANFWNTIKWFDDF